jgi:hypothetical protein
MRKPKIAVVGIGVVLLLTAFLVTSCGEAKPTEQEPAEATEPATEPAGTAEPTEPAELESLEPAESEPEEPAESTPMQITTFGSYEWLVLAVENDRVLLVTKDALDMRAFNEEAAEVTWETCSLRSWLNDEFYNQFTAEEQEQIAETVVVNEDNSEYGTVGGNTTEDKVFLLSLAEVEQYFANDAARLAGLNMARAEAEIRAEELAAKLGASSENVLTALTEYEGMVWWVLRSPGSNGNCAGIRDDGSIDKNGDSVTGDFAVRPALWLKL